LDWEALALPLSAIFCSDNGRPTDPVVYYKAFLVGYFEDIECDTDLAARLCDSLSIRRFLFGSLSGTPPDHSSLSRVRKRIEAWGSVDALLSEIVKLLDSFGLIGMDAVAIDTTLIPSRARRKMDGEVVSEPTPSSPPIPLEPEPMQEEIPPLSKDEVLAKPKPKPQDLLRPYDSNAYVASKPGYPARPSYKISVAADYKSRVVVSVKALLAISGEGACARISMTDTVRRLGKSPRFFVADAGMDESNFHAHAELYGSISVTPFRSNAKESKGFGKERFLYDPTRDVYICPTGNDLNRVSGPYATRIGYRALASVCAACPIRILCQSSCTTPKTVSRTASEPSRERAKARRKDPERRKLIARRKAVVEPVFADMKENGGMAMIWTQGLPSAQVKATMAGIGWNLKILLRHLASPVATKRGIPPTNGPRTQRQGSQAGFRSSIRRSRPQKKAKPN
jgi:transposase